MSFSIKNIIFHCYPLIILLIAWLFSYINLNTIILGYIGICVYVYITSKTQLYYTANAFNNTILDLCPSIKQGYFKPYFLLPFDLVQMACLKLSRCSPNKNITIREEEVNKGGVKLYWYDYEGRNCNDDGNGNGNGKVQSVLMLFPGITGKYKDEYVFNWAIEGLKQNYFVVVYQMRILSDAMLIPDSGVISLLDDVDEAITVINKKTDNKPIYAIGGSFGANKLINYLGTMNSNKRIKGGVSISNPYDFLLAQRFGQGTIYEDIIVSLEKNNFKQSILNMNSQISNYLNEDKLFNADNVLTFDGNYFRKILGYHTADDYYRKISCVNHISQVDVPLLCISAIDDHIATSKAIPYEEIEHNKNIFLLVTDRGSHMCFAMNDRLIKVKQWIEPIFEFLKAIEQKDKKTNE